MTPSYDYPSEGLLSFDFRTAFSARGYDTVTFQRENGEERIDAKERGAKSGNQSREERITEQIQTNRKLLGDREERLLRPGDYF